MQIILASTSPYRKALLQKLAIPFECASPHVDESPLPDESAPALAERLAIQKAQAISPNENAYVIGSDQVACVNGELLGKPGNHDNALEQLKRCTGQSVIFYTGLCLLDTASKQYHTIVEPFEVTFKQLTIEQMSHYLSIEKPYQCAGSFKSEGLGVLLFDALTGRDPNALIGLPLIALNDLFSKFNIDLLSSVVPAPNDNE
jgi:MAF protein